MHIALLTKQAEITKFVSILQRNCLQYKEAIKVTFHLKAHSIYAYFDSMKLSWFCFTMLNVMLTEQAR